MILCDDFVFIHYPKTGGTFVTDVLQRVFATLGKTFQDTHKHGPCSDIPAAYAGRPICACVRNPFDLKVSQYLFGEWKNPPAPQDAVRKRFPHFPALNFAQFLEAVDLVSLAYLEHVQLNPFTATLGQYSHRFLRAFVKDHRAVVRTLDEAALAVEPLRARMYPMSFLRTHRLNQDLHAFLLALGYPATAIGFILDEGKILPPGGTRPAADRWEQHYTPELKAVVRHKERLMFRLFPEFEPPA